VIQRREFITLLGGTAAVWPLAARAQQPKRPTIGYLGATTAAAEKSRTDLSCSGCVSSAGMRAAPSQSSIAGARDAASFAEIAVELTQLKVDVILATSTQAALTSKQATATIPIIFALSGDPLGTGLVDSLARPGGNVTGLSNQSADLGGKRLEILRELVPGLRQLAILANAGYPGAMPEIREIEAAAHTLGVEVSPSEVRRAGEIAPAFDAIKGRAGALYVVGDTFMNSNRVRIVTLAVAARLPTMYVHRDYVETGGLISYGANIQSMFRRAAELVDKILRGAKPGDLPVEQPTKFDLVVNLTTAKALGLTVSDTLLARADEVIE
jgi:putative ABC transport system substrate-binding protein